MVSINRDRGGRSFKMVSINRDGGSFKGVIQELKPQLVTGTILVCNHIVLLGIPLCHHNGTFLNF